MVQINNPTHRPRDPVVDRDRGWGWVVCVACFVVHVLTDGIFYSFGILYAELLRYFRESRRDTAWILSVFQGLTMGIGPLSAAAVNLAGCRITAAVGTILLSAGYLSSMFAPNIYVLQFTIGVLGGCGNGLLYFSAVMCVSQYFVKKRSLATGIGVSGSGIGTFMFGPVITLLIEKYNWQGAIMIQAAIVLNGLACALVFRPLDDKSQRNTDEQVMAPTEPASQHDVLLNEGNSCQSADADGSKQKSFKCLDSEENVAGSDPKEVPVVDEYRKNSRCQEIEVHLLSDKKPNPDKHNELEIISGSQTDRAEHDPFIQTNDQPKAMTEEQINNRRGLCSTLQIDIFKIIPFDLFVFSSFIASIGFYVPYIFLPDKAKSQGITSGQTAWLVASIGITNTISRVVFGLLADWRQANRLMLYNATFIITGVATALVPLCDSFTSLLIYTMVFGGLSGGTVCLRSVILADIVGIEKLATAFGVCNFFTALTIFIGPPLAGWLADRTGSYSATFIVGGTTLFVAGAVLLCIPCINSRKNMRK